MHFQRADGRDDHDRVGLHVRVTALDIEELFRTQISAEAGFRHGVIAELSGCLGSEDGVATVGDIGEGAAVYKGRSALQGLHQIRLDRVLEQRGHRALRLEITCGDGLFVKGIADDDTRQARLEIADRFGKAEDRQDLGRDGDIVAVLTRCAVAPAAQTVGHKTQLAVVHIHTALPRDTSGVDVQAVALIDMVIEHGGKQVVCRADGVHIAREMQIDVLHRDDLRPAASGSAALDAEHGAQRRLTQHDVGVLAQSSETVGKSDGGGGLAFTGRGGGHGGHENELVLPVLTLQDIQAELCFIFSVIIDVFLGDPCRLGDLPDRLHLTALRDLNISQHYHLP